MEFRSPFHRRRDAPYAEALELFHKMEGMVGPSAALCENIAQGTAKGARPFSIIMQIFGQKGFDNDKFVCVIFPFF